MFEASAINIYSVDRFVYVIAASGTGDRGLTLLKVIGGIVALLALAGVVGLIAALVGHFAYFIMAGSVIAAAVGFISGIYVVCWWAIGVFVVSLIARAVTADMRD